jgi:hypothetical protein
MASKIGDRLSKRFRPGKYLPVMAKEFGQVLFVLGFSEVDRQDVIDEEEGLQRLYAARVRANGRLYVLKVYSSIPPNETRTKEKGLDSIRVALIGTDAQGNDTQPEIGTNRVNRTPRSLEKVVQRIEELYGCLHQ